MPRTVGLSPRGRGNRCGVGTLIRAIGSIPAWAGEPGTRRSGLTLRWVYPRVGGGTEIRVKPGGCCVGLSPRGRGNLREAPGRAPYLRSIPAWAGEPESYGQVNHPIQVYPRVGGGTASLVALALSLLGLSPRGRGNQERSQGRNDHSRSIPAWAGEPAGGPPRFAPLQVYPRVGGGTPWRESGPRRPWGLSPRGRGNRFFWSVGEGCQTGLSPRGRGNHKPPLGVVNRYGSIPAWAGEPH